MSVPQFAFPLQLSGTDFLYREQDTVEEITDCVTVLLLTPIGSRIALPQYGTPEVRFAQRPIAASVLETVIKQWEPRALPIISDYADLYDELVERIRVEIYGGRR